MRLDNQKKNQDSKGEGQGQAVPTERRLQPVPRSPVRQGHGSQAFRVSRNAERTDHRDQAGQIAGTENRRSQEPGSTLQGHVGQGTRPTTGSR